MPTGLQDMTLGQLRILLVVHQEGSALRAARRLGRDQSSVQKTLDTLNSIAQRLIGESLVLRQGRGQDFLFTPTGEQFVRLAEATFRTWLTGTQSARRHLGRTVTIGTTEFTILFLGEVWQHLRDEFEHREVELNVVHVRTRDFWEKLESRQIDLVCGSFSAERGKLPTLDFDFIEWHREGVALLTNLSERELRDKPITRDKLATVPLLAPSAGLLAGFLRGWYGPDYRDQLAVIAEIDTLYYGLNLLDAQLLHGCLLTTSRVAAAAVEGRLAGGHGLRMVELADDFTPALEVVTGVFGRRNEREHYASNHPLNLLWNEFATRSPAH
jgi:DNA-binding transcriptional LysR family regulator